MKLIPSIAMPGWIAELKAVTSRCSTCHRSLVLRKLSVRKAGIQMRDCWYCSSSCFRVATEQEVSRLLALRTEPPAYAPRMPLGLSLISRAVLTKEQLRKATDELKEYGGELGEVLVRQGSVTEKQVTAARAADWGCPVFAVPRHPIQVGINIPSTLMQRYSMIPVHYVARTNLLLVGFVLSVEYGLLYGIEQMTGCKTNACFVTPSDFQMQMQRWEPMEGTSGDTSAGEAKFEDMQTPEEIARILCSAGVEAEAEEAFIYRCKDYLWARLKSVSQTGDFVFRIG